MVKECCLVLCFVFFVCVGLKQAIKFGSTNVRVGSTIFGARPPFKPKN